MLKEDSVLPAAYQLPGCQLVNQTVSMEKKGCPRCHPVETTICSGHCITMDPVMMAPRLKVFKIQQVCTYRELQYRLFELPDCPPGVDPVVQYPVALSCSCSHCAMATSDCTVDSLQPDYCTSQTLNYY
ncbi:Gonadotropin subunit beta-2 [Merluccius polli]|uniref:Gonadotropin subunit beta-2 n=1 Tax=Merluccius polli TaxID=89951 RepID=A0AA47P736_MERPO|nr:Gonadotropin subunit beta-2 [Merluccius polli]KAK0153531.1 Gonadotropin subunit beta-2 [Merluccius polli]